MVAEKFKASGIINKPTKRISITTSFNLETPYLSKHNARICGGFVVRYERKNRPSHAVADATCVCYTIASRALTTLLIFVSLPFILASPFSG